MKKIIISIMLCASLFSCSSFLNFIRNNPEIITQTIQLGMTIAEVLLIEGQPQDISHSDFFVDVAIRSIVKLSIYKYKNKIITFENGRVVKIESIR